MMNFQYSHSAKRQNICLTLLPPAVTKAHKNIFRITIRFVYTAVQLPLQKPVCCQKKCLSLITHLAGSLRLPHFQLKTQSLYLLKISQEPARTLPKKPLFTA